MRLYELAKALGVSTKEAADRLSALGHEVKANPQAAVPKAALRALQVQHPDLQRTVSGASPAKAPPKAKKAPPPPPEPTGPKRRIIKRAEEVAREREADQEVVRVAEAALQRVRTFEQKRAWYEEMRRNALERLRARPEVRGPEF